MTHRVGTDLNETARKTHESIAKLNERLAVIDTAQKNLTDLSTNMVSLQEILANKQARGAFGQMRMETIVKDGLPKGAYTFQATLSNGKRPDCLLHMPNTRGGRGDRRQVSARRLRGVPHRAARRGEEGRGAARAHRRRPPCRRHGRALFHRRRDAGHRHPVRAVGVDLCRSRRAFLRPGAEGASRAHRDLRAEHADARGADHAGDPEGRADARAGASHPGRGGEADGRHEPLPRARARPATAFRPGQRTTSRRSSPRRRRSRRAGARSRPWTSRSRRRLRRSSSATARLRPPHPCPLRSGRGC